MSHLPTLTITSTSRLASVADIGNLWGPVELGVFLGLKPATVQTLAHRAPARLPPRVASMGVLRWVPTIAHEWAISHSGKPKSRAGRPRG